MRVLSTLRGWLLLVSMACVAVAAGLAVWLLAFSSGGSVPHARQYLDMTACLLTGPKGVGQGTPAAPVWASMQAASVRSGVMVSYLPQLPQGGPQLLLSSMVQRHCGVIITTGAPPAAVLSVAKANPGQRFMLVTDTTAGPAPANTTVVSSADAAERAGRAVLALAVTA